MCESRDSLHISSTSRRFRNLREVSGHALRSTLHALRLLPLLVLAALAGCESQSDSGLGKDFTYDISELRKIDPKLIQFEEGPAIEVGLNEPRGLALDASGRLYVAGDEAIRVFNARAPGAGDGSGQVAEFPLGGAPQCLAVAADGTLYVGLRDHVEVYGPKGALKAKWESLGPRAVITAIAVAANDVFVADAGGLVVLRCDLAGKVVRRIGRADKEKNIPGFVVPSPYFDLAVGPEGLLWAANPGRHRLEGYTFDGDLEVSWGKASFAIDGFCGCCNPTNFAILPDGRFVTSEKGLPRVKIYKADGTLESVVAPPERFQRLVAGLDLAVDSRGRILVLDPASKSVRVFTKAVEK